MTKDLIVAILVLFITQSCKYNFDDDDFTTLDLYNSGDTLIFQNLDTHEYDSIRITRKEIRFMGLTEGYQGNPESCWTYYQMIPPGPMQIVSFGGQEGNVYSNEHLFMHAVKWQADQKAHIEIHYERFGGHIPQSVTVASGMIYEYIDIDHSCKGCLGIDSTDVIKIRWKPYEGIIQYQRNDNSSWTLVKKV